MKHPPLASCLRTPTKQSSSRFSLWMALQAFLFLPSVLHSQVLTWDKTPGTGAASGIQNGSGTWNTGVGATSNWIDALGANTTWANTGLETAQFGSTSPVNPSVITIASSMNLKGLTFLPLGTTTPVSGTQYSLNGAAAGTVLNFGDGGLIQLADFSSGGSQFVALGSNLVLQGSNLTLQKTAGSGAVTQFINLNMASNPNLTGTLTIGSYVYAGITALGTVSNVSSITVQTNGTLTLGPSNVDFAMPISASGYANTYGAIRVTGSNVTLSGGITMTGDMGVFMHSTNTGLLINAPITDNGAGYNFHRFSLTKSNGTLTLTAANTYSGKTVLGRATSGNTGGITILDFAGTGAPQENILYHGVATPGGLDLLGSTLGSSVLIVNGKAGEINSQSFGNVSVQGTRSAIDVVSGAGGTMNLTLGSISRTTTGMLALSAPQQGSITTTTADGFLGAWATFKAADGRMTWAQVQSGTLTHFTGTTAFQTGLAPSSDASNHLTVGSDSVGDVAPSGTLSYLGTLTMADPLISRRVTLASGSTLRLGANGGVQMTSDAQSLTFGESGVSSFLSSGGAATGATQLILTNNSATSVLTIHSGITNNAGNGAVTVLVNGAPNSTTVLTAAGTQTGGATLASGALEIRNGNALGTSGTVTVMDSASLRLSGGITFARAMNLSSLGLPTVLDGGIRSLSGNNTLTGLTTLLAPASIIVDADTLTIQAAAATNAITGSFNLTVGGAGNTTISGRLGIGSGILTKTGNGMLLLTGDNNYTGATTLSAGVLRVGHANALGTTAGATTISIGAALELVGGITVAEAITNTSTGINNAGGIRNISGDNKISGLMSLGSATTIRVHSDSGKLTFDTASGASIQHAATSTRILVFGGAGNIDVLDPVTRTSTGVFTFQKEGNGTLALATTVSNTTTTLYAGTLHLDFSQSSSPSNATNILYNGITDAGPLTITGGTILITGKSGANTSQAFGAVTSSGTTGLLGGTSYLTVAQNGASRVDLSFGSFTRNTGGIMGVTMPTTGSLNTTGGADNSILLSSVNAPFMWSINPTTGDEWLGTDSALGGVRNIVKLSSLTTGGYTASDATTLVGNADISAGVGTTTLGANTTITSLRFAQAQDTLITQDTTGRVLTVGGILVSSTVGNFTQTISVSTLKTPEVGVNNDLPIIQNNTAAPLVITSAIPSISGFATSLTKSGPGTLILRGVNTYNGGTRVQEGVLHLQSGAISGSTEFLLGSGEKSGKIILGTGSTAYNTSVDWLQVMGSGTDNRIVGGATVISTLTVDNPTANNNFRTGFLGGPGENENNLSLSVNDVSTSTNATTLTAMVLPLGPANTYAGQTLIRNAMAEVSVLADQGVASSFGTGSSNGTIVMGSAGGSTIPYILAGIRYVGTTDSVTNRPLDITNSVSNVQNIAVVLENNGTGALRFTSPITSSGTNLTAARKLYLRGTHTGDNQIVSVGNNGSVGTALVKQGTGTWIITGDSPHSGGTTVEAGMLLVSNTTGSGLGIGSVSAQAGTTIGGSGRIALQSGQSISLTAATLQIGTELPGRVATSASVLTLQTTGAGLLSLSTGSVFSFDLFSGAGLGDNSGNAAAADLAIIQGAVSLETGITLRVANPTGMTSWAINDQWRLFDWSGLTGSVSAASVQYELPTLPQGLLWNTDSLFTTGILSISIVPEPSRGIFMIFGMLALVIGRRRGGLWAVKVR